MECFTLFRAHLAMSGICIEKPAPKYPFNRKNSIILLTMSLDIIFLIKFLDEVNTFEKYTDILYEIMVMISLAMIFLKIVCNASELFELVDNLEDNVQQSE